MKAMYTSFAVMASLAVVASSSFSAVENLHPQILRQISWESGDDSLKQPGSNRQLGEPGAFTLLELDGLLEGSMLQYRINTNDQRVGRDTITIAYRTPSVGWLAIGFTDSAGQMVGSEAVIGVPATGQVLKYNLNAKNGDGVVPMQDDRQTLMDQAVVQDASKSITTLVFTKIMAEAGEKEIVVGVNAFLGAYSGSNSLGIHSNRQAFVIDLGSDIVEDITGGGGGNGADADQDEPPAVENIPGAVGQAGTTLVALEGSQLQGSNLQFKVNPSDPNAGGDPTVTFVYTVPQLGWVAIGFSDNGGFMVGSEAVIGLPDTGEVLKYELNGKTNSAVIPMVAAKQTLVDASITQDATSTTLTFTKRMVEDGEIPIVLGANALLGAYGGSNTLGIHSNRDSFALDLASGGVASVQTRKQNMWRAHGVFAGIAWGLLSPCAISASVLRELFGGPMWFSIHRGLNVLVVLFTAVAFGLAVVAINQETPAGASSDHFNPDPNPHRLVGLVVFVVALVQALLGIFRPHVPEAGEEKSTVRKAWEVAHKLLGYSCLGMAIYQVQSGIKIYYNIFAEGNYCLAVFWAVIAAIGGSVAVGFLTLKLTSPKSRPKKQQPKEGGQHNLMSHRQPDMTKYAVADDECPSEA